MAKKSAAKNPAIKKKSVARDAFGRFIAKQKRGEKGQFLPKAPPLPPPARSPSGKFLAKKIMVRDLPPVKGKSAVKALAYLAENAASFESLRRPDEKWGFEIDGTSSLRVFPDVESLSAYLGRYDGMGSPYFLNVRKSRKELVSYHRALKSLKLIRWPESKDQSAWYAQRKINKKRLHRKAHNRRKK